MLHRVVTRLWVGAIAVIGLISAVSISALSSVPADAASGTDLCALYPAGYNLSGATGATLIVGTSGADVLQGGSADDTIMGCGGDDTLSGYGGDDLLIGGSGDDKIYGGGGNDTIQSGNIDTFGGPTNISATKTVLEIPLQPGNVRDINVRMNIQHSKPEDLLVRVLSPFGVGSRMTDVNCGGGTTNACGPGTFSSDSSPETGVSFDSEAIISVQKSARYNRNLNGRFHPRDSLDAPYRNKSACNGTDCTWKLQISDRVDNGVSGTVTYAAIDVQYPQDQDGSDVLSGGSGNNDTISLTERNADLTYTGYDNLANDGASGEGDNAGSDIEWIYTGWGHDDITGTEAYNDIRTGQGHDRITGLGGNDRFRGGVGDDWLDGGAGTDKLDGNAGHDTCLNGESLISCEVTR